MFCLFKGQEEKYGECEGDIIVVDECVFDDGDGGEDYSLLYCCQKHSDVYMDDLYK